MTFFTFSSGFSFILHHFLLMVHDPNQVDIGELSNVPQEVKHYKSTLDQKQGSKASDPGFDWNQTKYDIDMYLSQILRHVKNKRDKYAGTSCDFT